MAAIRARVWQTEAFWMARIGSYLGGEHSPQQALAPRIAFVAIANERIPGAGERVAGFVAGHRTQRYGCDGELQWIDVAGEYRGQGIGGALLGAIAGWFVAQGACRICVNVTPENRAARSLYRGHGAKPLNEHWMLWEDAARMAIRAAGSNSTQGLDAT